MCVLLCVREEGEAMLTGIVAASVCVCVCMCVCVCACERER